MLCFQLKRPTHDPIRLREHLAMLLPTHLVVAAHFHYLDIDASRVADLLMVSTSTARNLRKEVVKRLGKLAALPEQGPYDAAALANLGMIDAAGAVLAEDEVAARRALASRYLSNTSTARNRSVPVWCALSGGTKRSARTH